MGHDVTIQYYKLTHEKRSTADEIYLKLKHGALDLDLDFWEMEGGEIRPIEWTFRWDTSFIDDLVKMARHGITGHVETIGEEGECTKYLLKDGRVEEYHGEVVYPEKPNEVWE